MKIFYNKIKSLYKPYDLYNSLIGENLKKDLFECLLDQEKIITIINEFDNMTNIKKPSFKILASRRNIIIKRNDHESDILKYWRSRGQEIYFRASDKFESQPRNDRNDRQTVWYDKRVKNNSIFFVSLAHEIWHCLTADKLEEILDSNYYKKNETDEFRESKLFDEIIAWYMAFDMCRFFMNKWFDVLEQFQDFDQFCDFVHLCILSYHTKKTPDWPLYLIDENEIFKILYGS